MGTSVRRAVIESLAGLLDKLMAWQAGRCSLSLKTRIASDRARVRALLFKNPSLAAAPELMTEAHKFMVREGEWRSRRARTDVIAIVSLDAGPNHRRRIYY